MDNSKFIRRSYFKSLYRFAYFKHLFGETYQVLVVKNKKEVAFVIDGGSPHFGTIKSLKPKDKLRIFFRLDTKFYKERHYTAAVIMIVETGDQLLKVEEKYIKERTEMKQLEVYGDEFLSQKG